MIFRSIFPAYSILVLSELHQSKAEICGAPLKRGLQLTNKIVCEPLGDHTIPNLDGDLVDWAGIAEHKLHLTSAMRAMPYASGDLSLRCSYDDTRIYMVFEVPGRFRFNTTDDHLCASMSTMWRVGEDADVLMLIMVHHATGLYLMLVFHIGLIWEDIGSSVQLRWVWNMELT